MWLILLLYGAAFVMMGSVLAIQARSPVRVLGSRALWLLAAFGFLHGAAEWCSLSLLVGPEIRGQRSLGGALIALSFAALLAFGIELEIWLRRWPRWARAAPLLLLGLQGGLASTLPRGLADPVFEAVVRYTAAMPGSVLASVALLGVRRGTVGARQSRYLLIAAVGFAVYAVVAGLLVPPAPLPVASVLHAHAWRELAGVPVEVLRAACAVTIGYCLAQAFVVESARVHDDADRMREEFIALVAHDLRGPLTAIDLLAVRLHRLAADEPGEVPRVADRIRHRVRGLERMVADLLDASRLEARRLVLQCHRLDLSRLVTEVVQRAEMAQAGHDLELEVGEGRAEVDADPARLEQVLGNLLSNAGKYSSPGTAIRISVNPRRDGVRVSVTSIGPEIPAEARRHLFERFYRADAAARGSMPGAGLGLYLARGLVEAHRGSIWLEPPEGGATTFTFSIPTPRRPASAEPPRPAQES